jgi:hypothetical protein
MKRRTLITTAIIGALSLGLLTATPVLAEGPGYGGGQHARFKQMDLNRDGKVTRHEARKVYRQVRARDWDRGDQGNHYGRFKRADLNRDGKVTRHEARKVNRQIRAQNWDWDRGGRN